MTEPADITAAETESATVTAGMMAPATMTGPAADPFAHLHDEGYEAAYILPRAAHDGMIAMGGRVPIPLDGDWRFTPDLFDEGLRQRWFADDHRSPSRWRTPRDHDPLGATMMAVPGCWTTARPEWRFLEGAAWYERDFAWDRRTPRLALRIGAANYAGRVFLNGRFLASHRGGSTPFFVELTAHLRDGVNRLMIQVENRRRPERVPMHHVDWFNDGGIHREVELVPLPALFIRQVALHLAEDGIRAEVTLSEPAEGDAEVAVPELGLSFRVPVQGGRGTAVAAADPERWSPGRPRLYDAAIGFGADRVTLRVGFRTIATERETILLNGQPIYLRGICVHEDDVRLGSATDEADIRRRFAHARELGCNFLRLAHYPHHERVAEIADEEGLMLWAEIPVYWAIDFANPDTYDDALNQLLELIERDRNRASVIIWGVGNENADTDERLRFMSALAEAARAADPTRLVGAACLVNRQTFRVEDRLERALDVIGLNEYFGWYEPDFAGLERLLANSHPGKPLVVTETGADALAGHHGRSDELFTEECQAEVYRRQLAIIATAPQVQGFCPWLLYDFRSERRQTRFQAGFNRKGLIAEDKATRKAAFQVLQAHYQQLAGTEAEAG